ncbi:AcrR family transcriptional regulator [Phyllobacterium trifolii]|uniref:AcrR family transcriptional regulator n=1 Tax=Phyllobacterium trifolii TaxID=300193 RepID=A0A839UFA7_9HYPH|nr:TetR/AcrR family transcriptional regulator [Phyllobacterium trifolii]MBB3148483.1 AcrR family transcriptional regulator [Phyllobacterium trifolii]
MRLIQADVSRPVVGRPRDPRTQQDILKAAASILLEEGYRALTMERLAVRAGVGKTTVYRRWKSMFDLVSDLLDEANSAWPMPQAKSDNITDDLRTLYRSWISGMSGAGKIIPILIAEGIQNPELANLLHQRFILPRRLLAVAMIERAISRGEISSAVDSGTAIDMFMGRLWYRQLITGQEIGEDDESKAISLMLWGLRGNGSRPD